MTEHAAPTHHSEVRADLTCVLCGRTAGKVQGSSLRPYTRMSLQVEDPQHLEAVRLLRCPACSGRLWLQNREDVRVSDRPLSSEELRPRRGRPPKIRRAS